MRSRKKRHKRRKWILIVGMVLLSILIGVTGYSFYRINNTMDQMYKPVDRLPTEIQEDENVDTKTFLLLGLDHDSQKQDDVGRTDVIMIAVINDKTKKISLASIPRDTYVEIVGKDHKDKINAAYQYGITTTIATVESFTGVHIDNYIMVNFDGIVRAVNAIGGIRLNLDENFVKFVHKELPEYKYPGEGEHLLNGMQALYFARFRHDSQGDFGRNNRQQQVIKAFVDQSTDLRSPLKIDKLLSAIGNGVETDLTKGQMIALAKDFKDYRSNNMESIAYRAVPARFGKLNLWYVLISDKERERVSGLLRERVVAEKGAILSDPTTGLDTSPPTRQEVNQLIKDLYGSTKENPKVSTSTKK